MAIIRFFSSNLKSQISNYNYEGIETTDTSFSLLDETSGMVFGGIEGSGFTYYSWSNIPSAGTINNIYSLAPDLARRWEVTGLTLSSNMNDPIRALRMDDPFGNLKTMFSGNDQIFGSKENDWMAYQGGSDVIDGGAGIDRLYFDTSFYASVTINLATGKQIMNGFVSTVVNIEEVVTTSASDTIVGSILGNYINAGGGSDLVKAGDGDDVILGGGSDDTLYGEAGNDEFIQAESSYDDDKIDGGSGIDSVVYRAADYSVNVNLGTSSAYKNKSTYYKDTLINIENAVGSRFNDELTGNDGNNVLDGGFGNDIINGGLGVDTVIYNNATHSVQINLNTGQAIGMGIDTISNVENANGSRFNDVFTGNSLANHFQGGLGVDIFNGGLGNDVLDGGAGSDWSYYNSVSGAIGVKVSLNVTGAQNTLAAGVDTLISIENLLGSKNADILIGNVSNNILSGGAGMDSLDGGAGNDRIIGGLDKDTLTGGAGADVFVIGNINDVLGQNFDTITDFLGGVDKIDLSGIDSNIYIAGDQSFSFIGSAQFSAAGQLRYANSMLYGDVTGDGVSDFSIALTGVTTFLSSHMIL